MTVDDFEVSGVIPRLHCRHCDDLIGTYEPMVVQTASGPRHTALAAEPGLMQTELPCFHRACYAHAIHDHT